MGNMEEDSPQKILESTGKKLGLLFHPFSEKGKGVAPCEFLGGPFYQKAS